VPIAAPLHKITNGTAGDRLSTIRIDFANNK
jgi:hypothetical protein